MESYQGKASQDERGGLSMPHVYVQLQFGVSWSQRHTPHSHSMTYMSKSLRKSSDFPRHGGQSAPKSTVKPAIGQTRLQETTAASQKKAASRSHIGHAARKPDERHIERSLDATRQHAKKPDPRRQHRSEERRVAGDRGRSAPPLSHNNPWITYTDYMTPAIPQRTRSPRRPAAPPHIWKTLPAPPSQFRLGSEGLPWSSWAYPEGYPGSEDGQEVEEEVAVFVNRPTTINLSPEARLERRHTDDPAHVEELGKLSLAMVTVDNGFENQWWYQGHREVLDCLNHGIDNADNLYSPQSDPGDNRLVSALEQTPTAEAAGSVSNGRRASPRMLVSPISEKSMSPAGSFRPVQRSLTTRSEELFIRT